MIAFLFMVGLGATIALLLAVASDEGAFRAWQAPSR